MSVLDRLRVPEPWTRPSFTMPMPVSADQLKWLGPDNRGRRWYSWRGVELVERAGLVDDTKALLPDGPVVEIEPGRWQTYEVLAPGSYPGLSNRWPAIRLPKPPPEPAPIDAIATTFLGGPQPERITALRTREGAVPNPLSPLGAKPHVKPAQPPAHGAEVQIARLRRAGADVRLTEDREYVILDVPGSRPGAGVLELFEAAKADIRAYLRGDDPARCVAGPHGNHEDPTAVTRLVGGAPSCARHATGVAR